jgi:N-acetylglucosamine-6-phosphate deacetylase
MSGPHYHAVVADHVFDGTAVLPDSAVIIEGSQVVAVRPRRELSTTMPMQTLPDTAWLAPGFIDVQVNGGGDVLFNDAPTAEGIRAIAAAHRRFGTTAFLPTLISDTADKMRVALLAVQELAAGNPSVLGIHLEGPFLSPEKPGVHDPAMFRTALGERDLDLLTSWSAGVVLVTLAPERVPAGFIAALARAGVRVSLGHSMATYAQTKAALAGGLTGFTHLFNAMRPLASREPGPIAAALETPGAWFGMIVDGQCRAARLAPKRLLEYRFQIGTDCQCPRYWIYYERRSALQPADPAKPERTIMRCQTCAAEFVISTP